MLRRLIRTTWARAGRDGNFWPAALLLLAVLVPTVCLLWFMSAAMRNERFAVREKLAEAYRAQLSASQARLEQYWRESVAELERLAATTPAPQAFAQCVHSGLVDSVVLFDRRGQIDYPDAPAPVQADFGEQERNWQEADRLEHLRNYTEAAKQYDALARGATNVHLAARAFQAEARCLLQSGQREAVVQFVNEVFGDERFRNAADPQGRLIVANAELMALELMPDRDSPAWDSISQRLASRLADYENPALAAPQRRFLMKEMQSLSPGKNIFPILAAEDLAAQAIQGHVGPAHDFNLQRGAAPGWWQFLTPNRRVLAVLASDRLLAAAASAAVTSENSPADAAITLVPPDADAPDAFLTLPAGAQMPGWRLAMSLKDRAFFETTAGRQTAIYLWTGLLMMGVMGILAALAFHLLRRQMTLARLKNDLAATVSHELKTPLSSMRVLVETLLDEEELDEQKTREYLRLISQENERLGRVIGNFLTFSRMERKKYALQFSPLSAREVIRAAVESMGGRLEVPGCQLEWQVEDNLPPILADADALTAALANLLENACKYSDDIKHIVVGARAQDGTVVFWVKDNGIGIAPGERKRIFQPFYQVDQRLSRKGSGCGLGLSIVQFIATAHHGSVSVESRPGCGSTFSISLPVAAAAKPVRKEAIA